MREGKRCPKCGKQVQIRHDGLIQKHRIPRAHRNQHGRLPYCPLSEQPRPLERIKPLKKECDHKLTPDTHAFRWPENLPEEHIKALKGRDRLLTRNIWNPLDPACLICGKNIGEIVGVFPFKEGH